MDINENNNRDAYSVMPFYFFSFSSRGFITRINETLLSRLGYEANEIIDIKKPVDLLNTGSRIFFQTHFYPLIKLHGKADEIFLSFLTKKGADLPVLLNVVAITDADKFEVHCAGMQISNRNRFEEEILQAKHIAEKALLENEELTRVKNELYENQRALELRLQRLVHNNLEHQQINSVISHDLQEPLRKVCIFSDKILYEASTNLDLKTIGYLKKINRASKKMRLLIINLQQYLSYNIKLPIISKYDLHAIVAKAKQDTGILATDHSIKVREIDFIEIIADREMMINLFTHLMNNSLKFRNKEKDTIEIMIACDIIKQNIFKETKSKYEYEDFVRITYTDNGYGFDERYALDIFELFRKGQDKEEGLGLGLAYCRKIAELHHGSISARSVINEGTVFTILLPLLNR